jgi:GST-like protein
MAGQAGHFRNYARETLPYAIERYTRELARLLGVMNKRLADRAFLAGQYSIADMACYGWIVSHERLGQDLGAFRNLKRWYDTIGNRPAVKRGMAVGEDKHTSAVDIRTDAQAHRILFGGQTS